MYDLQCSMCKTLYKYSTPLPSLSSLTPLRGAQSLQTLLVFVEETLESGSVAPILVYRGSNRSKNNFNRHIKHRNSFKELSTVINSKVGREASSDCVSNTLRLQLEFLIDLQYANLFYKLSAVVCINHWASHTNSGLICSSHPGVSMSTRIWFDCFAL